MCSLLFVTNFLKINFRGATFTHPSMSIGVYFYSTAPAAPAAGASRATAASAIDGEGSKRRRIAMDAAGFAEPARSTASSRKGAGKGKAQHKETTQRFEDYASDDDEADIYTPAGTSSSQGGAASSSCDGEED